MAAIEDPVEVIVSDNEVINPDPSPGDPVSENETGLPEDLVEVGEDEKEYTDNLPSNHVYYYNYSDDRPVSVSVNNEIDPNDLISVNSVSLNVLSADGLSLNSVSVNVSSNYIYQIIIPRL